MHWNTFISQTCLHSVLCITNTCFLASSYASESYKKTPFQSLHLTLFLERVIQSDQFIICSQENLWFSIHTANRYSSKVKVNQNQEESGKGMSEDKHVSACQLKLSQRKLASGL